MGTGTRTKLHWVFPATSRQASSLALTLRDFCRLYLMATEPTNTFNPLAAGLGWLLPGLGHYVIGERARGGLVLCGVAFLWITGLLIGGIDSVDRKEDKLWFYAQAGSGPIAFVVDGLNTSLLKSGKMGELIDAPNPSRNPASAKQVSSYKSVAQMNEYGTLFTALAGLMNIVALLDAAGRQGRTQRSRSGDG